MGIKVLIYVQIKLLALAGDGGFLPRCVCVCRGFRAVRTCVLMESLAHTTPQEARKVTLAKRLTVMMIRAYMIALSVVRVIVRPGGR